MTPSPTKYRFDVVQSLAWRTQQFTQLKLTRTDVLTAKAYCTQQARGEPL